MALALKNIHSDISLRVRNEFDHGEEGLYSKRATAPFIILRSIWRELSMGENTPTFPWLWGVYFCEFHTNNKKKPRMATGIRNPDCDFVRDPPTTLMSSNSNHRWRLGHLLWRVSSRVLAWMVPNSEPYCSRLVVILPADNSSCWGNNCLLAHGLNGEG